MIHIKGVLLNVTDDLKAGEVNAEQAQRYIDALENVVEESREALAVAVKEAEKKIGHAFELRLHQIGKGLDQEYEATAAFVKRVFEGMPPHVRVGAVEPYTVEQQPQVVIPIEQIAPLTADRSKGVPDIMH